MFQSKLGQLRLGHLGWSCFSRKSPSPLLQKWLLFFLQEGLTSYFEGHLN